MKIKIEKIIEAAEIGSKVLKKYFGKKLEVVEKSSPADFKTVADEESEEKILKILEKEFSDFSILTEEKGFRDKNSKYTFVIDPLDGTSNFVLGIPNFSVSIGLFKNNKGIAGVVVNPILKEVYFAQSGKGAFLNGRRIKVSRESDIKKATIGYDCDYGYYLNKNLRRILEKLEEKKVKRFMVNMSPALELCRVAAGRMEGFINNANEIYDFAAGKLIVKEAGGIITNFKGEQEINERNNVFLAANNVNINQELLEIMSVF